MEKRVKLIFLILLYIPFTQSQTSDLTREFSVIPPAPNVASLMKTIECPVTPFTGQPDINLPIYTLREGAISLPISIRYNGGGLKVTEYPSSIGMGWYFDAGGCISRTVYGLPDDINSNHNTELRGLFHIDDNTKSMRDEVINRNGVDFILPEYGEHILSYEQCQRFNDGQRDVANDILHLNCMGLTGTFIHLPESSHPIALSSPSAISISTSTFNNELPTEYYVTDQYRNKYYFTERDTTKSYHTYIFSDETRTDSIKYVSAWHLTKIKSITGDSIEISYIRSELPKRSIGATDVNSVLYYDSSSAGSEGTPSEISRKYTIPSVIYYPKQISEIKSQSVIVEFLYSDNNRKLQTINIRRNNTNRDLIQQYKFEQTSSYFRYFLERIKQIGTDNSELTLYEFSYNGDFEINNIRSQDHWGYYNGANNSSLVVNSDKINGLDNADREPNASYSQRGILTKIKYPTGGSTSFEWEQNKYSYIYDSKVNYEHINYYTDTSSHKLYGKNTSVQITQIGQFADVIKEFDIAQRAVIKIDMSKYLGSGMDYALNWNGYYTYHFEDEYMIKYPRVELYSVATTGKETRLGFWYIDKYECERIKSRNLPSGKYRIKLCDPIYFYGVTVNSLNGFFGNGADSNGDFGYIKYDITRYSSSTEKTYTHDWGGNRIKNITYADNGIRSIRKEYKYTDGDLYSNFSSGTVSELPNYRSTQYLYVQTSSSNNSVERSWRRREGYHSHGLYSTPNGGSHIEYPVVWEYYTDEDHKICYHYSSHRYIRNQDYPEYDINCGYIPGGSRMYTSYDFYRGNLKYKDYFRRDEPEPYKSETYTYNISYQDGTEDNLGNFTFPVFTGDFFRILDTDNASWIVNGERLSSDYATCIYKLLPYRKNIGEIITSETFHNDQYSDTVSYSYFNYLFEDHITKNLLKSKTIINTNGDKETTYYFYHKSTEGIVNLVEAEVTVCNDIIISARRMKYNSSNRLEATFISKPNIAVKDSYGLNNNVNPTDEENKEATIALKDIINIPEHTFKYDQNGNLVEISYNEVPLASFLWAYQGAHPIAEIKSISYTDLCNRLPANMQPAILSDRNNITNTDLSTIRNLFPETDVTTMTYHWLVGVAMTMDSRGIVTRYNYDEFGRLNNITDYNNYFIKQYQYNYKQ